MQNLGLSCNPVGGLVRCNTLRNHNFLWCSADVQLIHSILNPFLAGLQLTCIRRPIPPGGSRTARASSLSRSSMPSIRWSSPSSCKHTMSASVRDRTMVGFDQCSDRSRRPFQSKPHRRNAPACSTSATGGQGRAKFACKMYACEAGGFSGCMAYWAASLLDRSDHQRDPALEAQLPICLLGYRASNPKPKTLRSSSPNRSG